MNKHYLGDSVYADYDENGEVVLTTENRINVTNTIIWILLLLKNFQEWLKRTL